MGGEFSMKPDKSKTHLEQALRYLPNDFVFTITRSLLKRALNEINNIENKRNKRNTQSTWEQWQLDLQTNQLMSPLTTKQQKDTLTNIDKLITQEEQKIKNKSQKDNILLD